MNPDWSSISFFDPIKAQYFIIDKDSRSPFQFGICLYLCWAAMVIYGIGSSLYIFSGIFTTY